MRKYPKYKASGVDWLGEIPSDWNTIKIKFTDTLIMGQSPESKDVTDFEKGLPFLQGNAEFTDTHPIPKNWCEKSNKIAIKDDLLLSVRAPVGALNVSDQTYGIGRGLCAIRAKRNDLRFLYYLLSISKEELNKVSTGTTFVAITIPNLSNVVIPKVNLPEQHSIVRFLDYKTGQIDSFIANRQKQIELLKEQKAGIINKAVTKGINPNAKMKNSGIEWIGEVPEHWEIWKTKFLCKKVSTGNTPSSNELKYYENGTINWFTPGDFKDDFKMENSQRKVTEVAIEEKECKLFSPYSTYVIGIGATLGKVRMSETTSSANQQINILEFNKKVVPAFGFFYFYSIEKTIIANANLSTMGIINQTKMKSLEMTLPPIDEQSAILNYINNENLTFDSLISKYQKQIDLMQEYRTSLISQAITGKIDVREWQPKRKMSLWK
jgi:type I restriction enzyme S subunit